MTGANHGIGAAIVRALAGQGMRVFFTYYRPPSAHSPEQLAAARDAGVGGEALIEAQQQTDGADLVAELRAQGAEVAAEEVDFAAAEAIPATFTRAEAAFGPVDVLVCNHTVDKLESFDPALTDSPQGVVRFISAEGIDHHFAVNTRAYALLIAEFARRHVARGAEWGRVVVLSTDGAAAHAFNVSYAASKHAIESYARSAALELGQYGITVNIVSPGPTQTGYITPEEEARIVAETPLGRLGTPQDIAASVLWLASPSAGWLTGQTIHTGGGWAITH